MIYPRSMNILRTYVIELILGRAKQDRSDMTVIPWPPRCDTSPLSTVKH
jgi:hypothetical protein